MFGVEVLLRYAVPGAFMFLPLVLALTDVTTHNDFGALTATAAIAVLVFGYVAHQFYWVIFNLGGFYERKSRTLIKVLLEADPKLTAHEAWVEWELWFYDGQPQLDRSRSTRLWLFVHAAATAALAALFGLIVLVLVLVLGAPRNFILASALVLLYDVLVIGFAKLTEQNWRSVDEWEGQLARRKFEPIPRVAPKADGLPRA